MLKVTLSEESRITANFKTVRSLEGLIFSCTETSKCSAVPDIDLSKTDRQAQAENNKFLISMSHKAVKIKAISVILSTLPVGP